MTQDIICFSHLRWNFVFQRPQHLMTRAAAGHRVFYVEEPLPTERNDHYSTYTTSEDIVVVRPHLWSDDEKNIDERMNQLVHKLIADEAIGDFIAWYYTPMMLRFTKDLAPAQVVYDCMDELSAFKYADPQLYKLERNLLDLADVVFVGGFSLYEAKKLYHNNIHYFPSSIDFDHFALARTDLPDPADQEEIPFPRLGFFGVIDERFDIDLLAEAADLDPALNYVIIGPVVKIDPDLLPQRPNIFYLGSKKYEELPYYISHWDVALLLFAINESTKYISPTKTPEYLAAGKPVISTPITDVINPYETEGLVSIVREANSLVKLAKDMIENGSGIEQQRVDRYLSHNSWDITWKRMQTILESSLNKLTTKTEIYV